MYRRLACPLAEQPFSQPACVPGDAQEVYRGLDTILTTSGLASYTAYEFLLQAENELGSVDLPVWVRAVTAPAGMCLDNRLLEWPELVERIVYVWLTC